MGVQQNSFILINRHADGTQHPVTVIDDSIYVINKSYLQSIAEREVPNHEPWTKNGYNATLSATEQTLWAVGGDYVFPATAQQMEVVSSSANDASAGTGARTVEVFYLTNTFVEKSEIITLNGVTPVATVGTDIYRINNFRVKTTGTGLANAGDIDIRALADTPIYSRISTGINRAINCLYTVPTGKYLYVFNLLFGAASNVANRPVRFITKANYDNISGTAISFFMPYTNVVVCDNSVDVPIEIPTRFPEGVDIKVNAISPDGASYGSVAMRGWLEDA